MTIIAKIRETRTCSFQPTRSECFLFFLGFFCFGCSSSHQICTQEEKETMSVSTPR